MAFRKKPFSRAKFEAHVSNNSISIAEVLDLYKKGVITDEDYLFRLDGVKQIAFEVYKGAGVNTRVFDNHRSKHAKEKCTADANQLILDSFTT